MTPLTCYFIDIMNIPAREPFKFDSVHLYIADKKIILNQYVKIIDESENELIIEENIDYPRLMKFYKTKAYAQEILKQIIKNKEDKFNKTLDLPKIPNMMTDVIKENFKEKP